MKAKIYIIKNTVTDKVYVGQTTKTLEERFLKHIQDASVPSKLKRPLYMAMQKYGSSNFFIELLEECDFSHSDEREQYWIKRYDAFGAGGYNATVGGRQYEPYDYERIASLIAAGLRTREIMASTGCCKQLVYRVAKLYNIHISGSLCNKRVCQSDIDGNVLRVFDSTHLAAKYIKEQIGDGTSEATIRKNISRCCNSQSRTKAYGYKWCHAEN